MKRCFQNFSVFVHPKGVVGRMGPLLRQALRCDAGIDVVFLGGCYKRLRAYVWGTSWCCRHVLWCAIKASMGHPRRRPRVFQLWSLLLP